LAKAIRLADELEDMGFVREAVQPGSGQAFIAKDLHPVGKTEVGGDYVEYPELSSLGQRVCAFGGPPTG
jgi:hypothetical protein